MSTPIRYPAVAGSFYPRRPDVLLHDLHSYTAVDGEKLKALGCVVPHAGYIYSGHVAGAVYARLQLPQRYIILCPNHTGLGEPVSVMSEGRWLTPLGEVPIDTELASELKKACELFSEDQEAHLREHALEVQLPFLQSLVGEFTFVPVTIGISQYDALARVGKALTTVLANRKDEVLVIASSDMNHFEDDSITRAKDAKAIERILDLDPRGLFDVVLNQNVTMCGYGPAIAMMTGAVSLGARTAKLAKYATSADVSGDRERVVGYAGVIVC